jgi:hypothetical protein
LLIVDEAHNLTGNAYGEAVKLIIKNSTNLKVVLLSATPMKNLTTYWTPAGSFGATLVGKDLGGKTFKQLLDQMVADMLV